MLLETLRQQRKLILELAHKHGASNVLVFGSVARGEECAGSDIDILVTLPSGYDTFLQRIPLCDSLSRLLNREVDLVPEHKLNKHLRDQILGGALRLLAKAGICMHNIFWTRLEKLSEYMREGILKDSIIILFFRRERQHLYSVCQVRYPSIILFTYLHQKQ